MATWRNMLEGLLAFTKDEIETLVFEPADIDLDKPFDDGFGIPEGVPFRAYSNDWIYICTEYDGAESLVLVPRNPGMNAMEPTHY